MSLPRASLRVVASTETPSATMKTAHVYAVIDGEIVGELPVSAVDIRMKAGDPATVTFEMFVGANFSEIELRPGLGATA